MAETRSHRATSVSFDAARGNKIASLQSSFRLDRLRDLLTLSKVLRPQNIGVGALIAARIDFISDLMDMIPCGIEDL